MCGIIGFYGEKDVVEKNILGLISIQHRGQDSCGVHSLNGSKFTERKWSGLVSENRCKEIDGVTRNRFSGLAGNMALGHVRYSTAGDSSVENAQPFYSDMGVSLCHNGNVTNVPQLKEELMSSVPRRHVNSDCDADIILKVFVDELAKHDLKTSNHHGIFDAVEGVMKRVQGSYSALSMISRAGFVAFRDPYGIKPIVFGRKKTKDDLVYGFASESIAFDALGFELIDNLRPGEGIFIDRGQQVHRKIIMPEEHRPCVFEYIYFAHPVSTIDGVNVYDVRFSLGKALGLEWKKVSHKRGLETDIVCDVPESSSAAALGFSHETGIPYAKGLIRNNYIHRSFIKSDQKSREETVALKIAANSGTIRGKKVMLIDDSIVRGTTSSKIVGMLRQAGAEKVYFGSSAPPIRYPCVYGIDMSVKKELIASKKSVEEIKNAIGADMLLYQTMESLKGTFPKFRFCDACFTGEYPTKISLEQLTAIEDERMSARGAR